jgi:hypothetical protein
MDRMRLARMTNGIGGCPRKEKLWYIFKGFGDCPLLRMSAMGQLSEQYISTYILFRSVSCKLALSLKALKVPGVSEIFVDLKIKVGWWLLSIKTIHKHSSNPRMPAFVKNNK